MGLAYHKPSLKRGLYAPTRTQRGGSFYLMVPYADGVFSMWGARTRDVERAVLRADDAAKRFGRAVVMRDGQALPVYDTNDAERGTLYIV